MNFGFLIFPEVEELDFVGPWEILTASAMLHEQAGETPDRVLTIAERMDPIRGNKGMRVLPDATFDDHPPLDVVLVPGGNGTRTEAGPGRGRRLATHWSFEDTLEARGEVTVVRDERWVVDGNVVSSQGVSAGIDMALWLVGQLHSPVHARATQRYVQYDPAPPYQDVPFT
jgi:transcriptional regulator GlxA family with amidase domain